MQKWQEQSPIGKILGRAENEQRKKEEEIALKAEASKERKEKILFSLLDLLKPQARFLNLKSRMTILLEMRIHQK